RSVGFGVTSGAALGVAGFGVLAVYPWESPSFIALPVFDLFAAVIGAVMGGLVGFICGLLLVVAGPMARGDGRTVRRISSIGACAPFVLLAVLDAENGGVAWELGGWFWWLIVAAMAFAAGAAIGPHVVGGRADPLAAGHSCFRHCRITRGVGPG
ncbi:MAG TPA: hypothetical protein VGD55_05220, partial [Acidothermaceae bacterium]